ncbi:MAG: N-acetyltransferase family protein [Bacteroidota bacterium]
MNTNRFNIRLVEEKDTVALRDIYAHYVENTHVSFEYRAPDSEEFRERILTITEEFPWLVCLQNDKAIGYAYAHKHRLRDAYQWSPESTIYLAPDFHTKGIGSILYKTLFDVLKLQGYHTVFAGVALPNEKSVGIHQRMGFEDIGIFQKVGYKNGKWHDTRWFQLNLQGYSDEPVAPRKLQTVESTAAFARILTNANQELTTIHTLR